MLETLKVCCPDGKPAGPGCCSVRSGSSILHHTQQHMHTTLILWTFRGQSAPFLSSSCAHQDLSISMVPQMTGPMVHGGSPEQAQMMHPAQQGHMPPGYAMYNPGMMYVGPQASSCHLSLNIPPLPSMHTNLKRKPTPAISSLHLERSLDILGS